MVYGTLAALGAHFTGDSLRDIHLLSNRRFVRELQASAAYRSMARQKRFADAFDELRRTLKSLHDDEQGTIDIADIYRKLTGRDPLPAGRILRDDLETLVPRATRSVDELLVNGKVPSREGGEFHRWFDEMTPDEFDQLWAIPQVQKTVRDRLLFKGGHHEWLVRSRANVFKRWGLSVKDIANLRVLKERVWFKNPTGRHSATGSTAWHNELIQVVDDSSSFADFKRHLNTWADRRLDGGRDALPKDLRQ
jgi:hypothetical protein